MKNFKLPLKTLLTLSSLFLLVGCQQAAPTTDVVPTNPTAEINSAVGLTPATTLTTKPTTTKPTLPPTPVTTQTTKSVAIQNMSFNSRNLTVTVGTKVKWTNNDSVPHTATSDTGVFGSDNLSKGQSFEFTFDKEGTYAYHCAIHPSMKGTITVTKAAK